MRSTLLLLALIIPLFYSCKKSGLQQEETTPVSSTKSNISNYYFPLNYEPGKVINIKSGKNDFYLEKWQNDYLLEGDIVITAAQVAAMQQAAKVPGKVGTERTFINNEDYNKRWPGGKVYYTIAPNVTAAGQSLINSAIAHWEANTSIRFVFAANTGGYIQFTAATGNNSKVGRQGGMQVVNFVQNTFSEGALIHEIGHAIGLYHEQSRTDRNSYININWGNIKPDHQHNFKTYVELGESGNQIGVFDFNSIMLYGSYVSDPAFVYNTSIPVITKTDGSTYTANGDYLSTGDRETVAYLYGPPYAKITSVNTNEVYDQYNFSMDVEFYIKFYSDPQCTIPYTLTAAKSIRLMLYQTYTYNNVNSSDNQRFYQTLPPGQQTYFLGSYQCFSNEDYYANVSSAASRSLNIDGGEAYKR